MRIGIVGALAALILLQACSTRGTAERDLIIAPAPVACAGDPPATCLQVSEPNGDKWLMALDAVEGFTFEPGYSYEIEAREPPLDVGGAFVPRLTLIRVVSKEPGGGVASPLGQGAWRLESIDGVHQEGDETITASFHGGGWVDGFGGCNSYLAGLTVDGDKVTISTPNTGPTVCAKATHDRERDFLKVLADAQSYRRDGDRLELTSSGGSKIAFQKES